MNMIDLTNLEEIKKLDPKNVYGSTGMLADQCNQVWNAAKQTSRLPDSKAIKSIIICGMGGSAYGAHIAIPLLRDKLNVPLLLNDDYGLPAFVDSNSLVILTSYSGTTEESLSAGKEALKRKAHIAGITSGGKLSEFLTSRNAPSIIFSPQFNPSGQPRLGTGYIIVGTLALLHRLKFVHIGDNDVKKAVGELKQQSSHITTQAMKIAKSLYETIPVIFAAEFLKGNAHIMRNQCNETAKSFSAYSELPELNHHLMEGLKNPKNKKMTILFINSALYSDVLQRRIALTQDVVKQNKISSLVYETKGATAISQMLNTLSFGGYLSLYLALLYGQDPSVIPWVDYFKKKLKQK